MVLLEKDIKIIPGRSPFCDEENVLYELAWSLFRDNSVPFLRHEGPLNALVSMEMLEIVCYGHSPELNPAQNLWKILVFVVH